MNVSLVLFLLRRRPVEVLLQASRVLQLELEVLRGLLCPGSVKLRGVLKLNVGHIRDRFNFISRRGKNIEQGGRDEITGSNNKPDRRDACTWSCQIGRNS